MSRALIAAIARPTVSTFSCDIAYSVSRSGLRRERYGSRSGERTGELGEDRQVGVKLDPLDASDSHREGVQVTISTRDGVGTPERLGAA